jgi:hypothetical protein
MEKISNDSKVNEQDFTHIKGWGIDADPENEPTYPMKHYTGDDHKRLNWERPPLQPETVEILQSIERPSPSAVFGTSTPPSGLSGQIRRWAFQYSEDSYLHWLPLVLADKINVVEGIVDDIKKGHIPNIIEERGWKAEWKYNRQNLIKNVAIGVAVTFVAVKLLSGKKKLAKG